MPGENNHGNTIGVLAGWGDFPLQVAKALKARGYRVVVVGVRDHADPQLAEIADVFAWTGIAQLTWTAHFFRKHGAEVAAMAGKIHKVLIYQPWLVVRHLPDWQSLRAFWPYFISNQRDRKDDTILGMICDYFRQRGVNFVPATDFAPELLRPQGVLTRRTPSEADWRDIAFGWQIAKELGRLDCGQSVAVKDMACLALEAIEGTDRCIERAGQLCKIGAFTVVKTAKPNQDMRFDVPTIGLRTLQTMVNARAKVLAFEAQRTIVLEEAKVIDFANRHGICVVSLSQEQALQGLAPHNAPDSSAHRAAA